MFVSKNDAITRKNPFVPDFIASSVAEIDFEHLRKQGVRACLIDLDRTVVSRAAYDVSDEIKQTLQNAPVKIYIATNRPKRWELKNLKDDLRADGVFNPKGVFGKPFKRYFLAACKDLELDPKEVAMIGDRFLQDIYGPTRVGIKTILISQKIGPARGWFDAWLSVIEYKWAQRLARKYHAVK